MTANRPKNAIPRRMLNGLIALILISTMLFVVGIVLERTTEAAESPDTHTETSSELVATSVSTVHSEAGESAEEHANEAQPTTVATVAPHTEAGESAEEHANEVPHTETVLGIDLENPVFVIGAVVVWLVLIIGLLTVGYPVLWLVIIVALGTTVFDVMEVSTQLSRGSTGIAILAVAIAVAHIGVAVMAWNLLRQRNTAQPA